MGRSYRRKGRENALQVLYQLDRSEAEAWDPQAALSDYFANFDHAERVRSHVERLVRGVAERRAEIDQRIEQTSTRWRLERMAPVDRNLLRLATFELVYDREVPRAVVINEAIEIARRFGSETSPGFVNGILDEVARALGPEEAS